MAAKALLSAAGLLKPNTKVLRAKSTATEHATSASSTATEHAPAASTDDVSRLPLTGLPMSTSELQASASKRYLVGDNDLEKIVALLLWMAQDFQAQIKSDDIHIEAIEALIRNSNRIETGGALGLLHTTSAAKLSQLIDIMMQHKDGSPKDANATLHFMRRVARIREEVRATAGDNATERVELDEDEVSLCYRKFGRVLLTEDLLPKQMNDEKYRLQNKFEGDTSLTKFQRSFTDNMLRKFLGDKRVAFAIWQKGIPRIVDHPVVLDGQRRILKTCYMGMLQSDLDECLQWYSSLANDIMVHRNQEGFDAQVSAGSLDERDRQQQQTRREALQQALHALRRGADLAKQRDDNKRSYDDMAEAEQKLLEDYDTGKTKKAKQSVTLPKMKPFRCKLQFQ